MKPAAELILLLTIAALAYVVWRQAEELALLGESVGTIRYQVDELSKNGAARTAASRPRAVKKTQP